jgi:transcriptional regulator with XRE-family HTH domain
MISKVKRNECPTILHFKIKASRRHAQMTQQQLADKLDVSRPAISLWESTDPKVRNEPTRTRLRKLSVVTGVPLHWLMDDCDNTLPENFDRVIRDIEAINHQLGDLSPEQLAAIRTIIDAY